MKTKIYLLIAVILWGWSFVFTKIALDFVRPVDLMGLRFLTGLPVLFFILYSKKLKFQFEKKDYIRILFGALVITAHFLIQITGVKYTSATNTGWIISVTPLVMAVLSFIILKEKIGIKEITGIIVATLGILLLVSNGSLTNLDWLSSTGDWLVLISAHTWAIFTVITRDVSRKYNPLLVSCAILLPSGLIIWSYMGLTSDWLSFLHLPLKANLAIIILGVFCLGLAHWFWQEGVAAIGATRAGIFLYLEPVATTALAVPYLGEYFGLFTALGGMMVLSGVFIAEKRKKK